MLHKVIGGELDMYAKTPAKKLRKIEEMWKDGEGSLNKIAQQCDVSWSVVARTLHEAGLRDRRTGKPAALARLSDEKRKAIVDIWQAGGASVKTLAQQLQVSEKTIKLVVADAGLDKPEKERKEQRDEPKDMEPAVAENPEVEVAKVEEVSIRETAAECHECIHDPVCRYKSQYEVVRDFAVCRYHTILVEVKEAS